MVDALRSVLRELEEFGASNDAGTKERQEKMLNVTPDTGELLAILVRATRARRVLEIGTSNGYSTLWLAEAVQAISGNVVTVEISAAKTEMARRNLERAGLAALVRQEIIEAGQFLAQQAPASCDLLFLDADRAQYLAWWQSIQGVLVPGGLMIIDNAVSHAEEMESFRAQVQAAPGWRLVVVPIGKGELMALKPMQ
ncbi:MAG: class I SAM-dependent methyltransferase [Planctomycetia bacterium]|nr:class I SAM-dependent methyltransferase [Planctomycetia bacterium]